MSEWVNFGFGILMACGLLGMWSILSSYPGRLLLRFRYNSINKDIEDAKEAMKVNKERKKRFEEKVRAVIGE